MWGYGYGHGHGHDAASYANAGTHGRNATTNVFVPYASNAATARNDGHDAETGAQVCVVFRGDCDDSWAVRGSRQGRSIFARWEVYFIHFLPHDAEDLGCQNRREVRRAFRTGRLGLHFRRTASVLPQFSGQDGSRMGHQDGQASVQAFRRTSRCYRVSTRREVYHLELLRWYNLLDEEDDSTSGQSGDPTGGWMCGTRSEMMFCVSADCGERTRCHSTETQPMGIRSCTYWGQRRRRLVGVTYLRCPRVCIVGSTRHELSIVSLRACSKSEKSTPRVLEP